MSALLMSASAAAAEPPGNDEYQAWFDETIGFSEFQSTAEATADGEPLAPGDPFGCRNSFDGMVHQMGATVWYRVKGTDRDITLTASGFDTMIAVYDSDGSDPPTDDNIITCNDDVASGDVSSRVQFPSSQGSRYLVQVGGCCDATPDSGDLTFVATSPPPNDARASAKPVVAGTPALADNLGAVTDAGEDTRCEGALPQDVGKTVWFKYTAPSTGDATFASSGFDTILQVYRGNETSPLGCNDDGDPDHP
jgi:hypothetical protein